MKTLFARLKGSFTTRAFRLGGYSVAAVAIVLALAVAVNLLFGALPAKWTQWDITPDSLYSLSDESEKALAALTEDVDIYWIVQSGKEDSTLRNLLSRFEGASEHITVTGKDPDVYPTFVRQYVSDTVYNNSLIVMMGDKYRYIAYEDIFEYDYSSYYSTGTMTVNFDGEGEITAAINYLVRDDLPVVYTLTGHGEEELPSSYVTAAERQNISFAELSLLTEDAVPEDAACLIIANPQSDISSEEKTTLLAYLQKGGHLLLVTELPEDGTFTRLLSLMEYYGVEAADGIVIEGSRSNYAMSAPYYLLPELKSHAITSPLISDGYYVLLPVAQGLTVQSELRDGLTVKELLTTSDSAFSKAAGYALNTYEKEEGDTDGPFALAVAITETADEDETRIVWCSSAALLSENTSAQVSGGNQDFFLNALSWMCDQEEAISIHAKSLTTEYLTISSGAASLFAAITIFVLPAACLAAGIVVFVRRKRK